MTAVQPNDAGCGARTSSFFGFDGNSQRATTGATALDYPSCQNGISVWVTAARVSAPTLNATCRLNVTVTQVAKPPVISDCGPRSVNERTIAGTPAGAALVATTTNIGTSIFWSINDTVPFSIGACDGIVRVLTPVRWKVQQTYTFTVIARNDGSSIGIGSSSSSCVATVTVLPVYLPPKPSVTTFSVAELSPVGTFVGNMATVDPEGFPVRRHAFTVVDVPDAFAVDAQGNVTVKAVVDTLLSLKSIFAYTVNVSNECVACACLRRGRRSRRGRRGARRTGPY